MKARLTSFISLLSLLLGIVGALSPTLSHAESPQFNHCSQFLTIEKSPSQSEQEPLWIIVTTALSSGAAYVKNIKDWVGPEATARLRFLHVGTAEKIDAGMQKAYRPQDFDAEVIGVHDALEFLKDKQVISVFTGTEPGVPVTDELNELLSLPGNGTELSAARRDKFLMQEALANAGVRSIPSFSSDDLSKIKNWVVSPQGNNDRWPVVIKPLDSAGTVGFHLCRDLSEVELAYNKIIHATNLFGEPQHQVLAQSYIPGNEYVVNIISSGDEHLVAEVWSYHKKRVQTSNGTQSSVYDYDTLIDPRDPTAKRLIDYAKKALQALKIKHGPSHMEIMMTPFFGNGIEPVMIEVGVRLMGGSTEIVTRDSIGLSAIDLSIAEALNPSRFLQIARSNPEGMIPKKSIRRVLLISEQAGRVKKIHKELLSDLQSIAETRIKVTEGGLIDQTADLMTSPGEIWLNHADEAQVERELRLIRERQNQLFELEEPEWIVVASALTSGSALAPAIKEYLGKASSTVRFLHVNALESKETSPKLLASYRPQDFDAEVIGAAEALQFLKNKKVRAVFTGSEPGVYTGDVIREKLGISDNGTELSEARRNKYLMQEALKASGVRSIPTFLSANYKSIRKWIRTENNNRWPVVIKPLDSAGGVGFHICNNLKEVKSALKNLKNQKNLWGENTTVVTQPYIPGDEYVVNIVSSPDADVVAEVWQYKKSEVLRDDGTTSRIYDYDTLLDPRSPIAQTLIAYAKKVLPALKIKHGPTHNEIMMTDYFGNGIEPVLIESGSRLMGGKTEIAMRGVTGTSPLDLTILSALDPENFKAFADKHPEGVIPNAEVRMLQLISHQSGRITQVNTSIFEGIPSVFQINMGSKSGDLITKTDDLIKSPGSIWLIHPDPVQIQNDIAEIRRRESKLFEIAPISDFH